MTIAMVAVALALLAIALAGAGAPLLRPRLPAVEPPSSPVRDRRRAISREIDDLDAARAEGSLPAAEHEALRTTARRRLAALDERLGGGTVGATSAGSGSRASSVTTAVLVVALAAVVAVPALLSAAGSRAAGQPITGTLPSLAMPSPGAPTLDGLRAKVRSTPGDIGARLALARAEFDRGRLADATTQYLAVLRLDPTNPEATGRLGLILGLSGRPSEGLRTIDRALRLDPAYDEARFFRALIELRVLHRPAAAIRSARAFLQAAGPHTSTEEIAGARRLLRRARAAVPVDGGAGT